MKCQLCDKEAHPKFSALDGSPFCIECYESTAMRELPTKCELTLALIPSYKKNSAPDFIQESVLKHIFECENCLLYSRLIETLYQVPYEDLRILIM